MMNTNNNLFQSNLLLHRKLSYNYSTEPNSPRNNPADDKDNSHLLQLFKKRILKRNRVIPSKYKHRDQISNTLDLNEYKNSVNSDFQKYKHIRNSLEYHRLGIRREDSSKLIVQIWNSDVLTEK